LRQNKAGGHVFFHNHNRLLTAVEGNLIRHQLSVGNVRQAATSMTARRATSQSGETHRIVAGGTFLWCLSPRSAGDLLRLLLSERRESNQVGRTIEIWHFFQAKE